MLRRLIRLNLIPKRQIPLIVCRGFMQENASPDKLLQTDDIVEELRVFTNAKQQNFFYKPLTLNTAVSLFKELLECDEKVATQIAQEYKIEIKSFLLKELRQQIETYIEVGFDRKLLLRHSELLTMIPAFVREKLEILREMPKGENGHGLNDYLPLMKLETEDLKKLRDTLCKDEQMKMEFGNRIHFLSNKLGMEPYKISELFLKYPYLRTLRRSLIIKNTELFLRYNVPQQKIYRSSYTLVCNPKRKTQPRLEGGKKVKGEEADLVAWLAAASKKSYNTTLKYASDNIEPLKEVQAEDNIEYLCARLGYSREEIKLYIAPHLFASRATVRNLKSHLDFLLDEAGYPPEKIVRNPKVFSCSVKTLRKHHEELKKINHELESLYPLYLPAKEWNRYIQTVKEDKNYQLPPEE